jgi:predicted permease
MTQDERPQYQHEADGRASGPPSSRRRSPASGAPPRWADRLLAWFCAPHLLEEVQGDLQERFSRRAERLGPGYARRQYVREVLGFLRPGFLKKRPNEHPVSSLSNLAMLRNYFTVAFRNLVRHKSYAGLNVLGLGLSMACGILIFTLVTFHLGFDRFHADADRIYRIVTGTGHEGTFSAPGVYVPMGRVFRDEYTFAEKTGRVATLYGVALAVPGGKPADKFVEAVAFAEPEFLEIMQFPFVQGTPQTALGGPGRVVLTQAVARRLFGDANPVGRPLRLGNKLDVVVSGVLRDLPANTDRREQVYASFDNLKQYNEWYQEDNWGGIDAQMQCFVRLKPTVTPARAEAAFKAISRKYIKDPGERKNVFHLQPLLSMHTDLNYDGRIDKANLWALSLIGLLLVVTACVNFVNLATAQALRRAKEVGIRKVLGSRQAQLFWQFMAETALISGLAAAAAAGMAYVLMPLMNRLFQTDLALRFDAQLALFLLALTAVVTLLSGSYPGLILARFRPVVALKGRLTQKHVGGFSVRRLLVVGQLALSQMLILGTIVITSQMRFSKEADLGFNKNAVVMLPMPVRENAEMSTLKARFMQIPGVENVSFCFQAPASFGNNMTSVRFDNREADEDFLIHTKDADEAYMATFDLALVAGRNIIPSDTTREFVINETALKMLGLKSPQEALGKMLYTSKGRRKGPIVGVMKDFYNNSFRGAINPICIRANREDYGNCAVKINRHNTRSTLASLDKIWNESFPAFVYSYQFLDDQIAQFYALDELMLKLIGVFASIAILISCLGLFGMISFMAGQKTKEIGIRKVLGAEVQSIVWLFGKEFLRLTAVAVLLAAPVAWWVMRHWLQGFVYKIDMAWWMFALAGGLAVLITLLTVSYQSLKAALTNPVTSLRSE